MARRKLRFDCFKEIRESLGLSIRKLSEISKINRRAVVRIEGGEFDHSRFGDVVRVSKALGVNIAKFISDNYDYTCDEYKKEEIDVIVNKLAEFQLESIYSELSDYAKNLKVRMDDLDIKSLVSNRKNFHKLIILNQQLKEGKISKKDALKVFSPIKNRFNRREQSVKNSVGNIKQFPK